jgi:hypothetical protein
MKEDGKHRETQLPVEVVRDLLGIARALYAALVELGPDYDTPRFKLRGIGYQLNLALERAGQGGPGTFPHRCSWLIAEKALDDLNVLIDAHLPAKALLKATEDRLLKQR